jgi:hypothetical protein
MSQFDLVMRTAEGDVINLSIYQNSNAATSQQYDGEQGIFSSASSFSSESGYAFQVKGDLNEQEQQAVSDFLTEMTTLTDAFLEYDLPGVLAAVGDLSLPPELAGFAFNLKTAFSAQQTQQTITERDPLNAPILQLPPTALTNTPNATTPKTSPDAYASVLLDSVTSLIEEAKAATDRLREKFDTQLLDKLPRFLADQWWQQERLQNAGLMNTNNVDSQQL